MVSRFVPVGITIPAVIPDIVPWEKAVFMKTNARKINETLLDKRSFPYPASIFCNKTLT